jgi:DNA-binding SARP family transcriptional activator
VIRSRKLPAPANADARWPWPLWLNLMGSFELRRDGRAEPGGAKTQQKPLELLRLLACERTLALGLDAAVDALWPEADDPAARKSFEMAALRLRRLLGDATLLWVSDGRVGLDTSRASSDVQQRRRLIERLEALAMKPAGHDGGSAVQDECLLLVEQVIAFTRGELLPGLPAAPWLEAQRRQTRNDTVRAAMAAANVLGRHDASPKERELLETALRIEPLAESLVLRLMQAHAREGRRGDALRIFERYRQQLVDRGASVGLHIEAQWRALLNAGTGSPR